MKCLNHWHYIISFMKCYIVTHQQRPIPIFIVDGVWLWFELLKFHLKFFEFKYCHTIGFVSASWQHLLSSSSLWNKAGVSPITELELNVCMKRRKEGELWSEWNEDDIRRGSHSGGVTDSGQVTETTQGSSEALSGQYRLWQRVCRTERTICRSPPPLRIQVKKQDSLWC